MFPIECKLTSDELVLLKSLDCCNIEQCIDILIQLEQVSSKDDDFYILVRTLKEKLEKEKSNP